MTWGNGTPAIRIWPHGTHRKLGVISTKKDQDDGDLPDNVTRLMTPENDYTVWGDFHFCPAAPERAGWMRFGTVDQARRLFVPPR